MSYLFSSLAVDGVVIQACHASRARWRESSNNHVHERAKQRIASYRDAFRRDGTRLTENPDCET